MTQSLKDPPQKNLHPRKLTVTNGWIPKIMGWSSNFLFNWVIFRFHVNLLMILTPKRIPTLFQDSRLDVVLVPGFDFNPSGWFQIITWQMGGNHQTSIKKNGCLGYQTRIFFQCSLQAIKTPKLSSVVCGTGSVSYLPRLGKEHSGTTTPITAMQGIRGFRKSKLIINHLEPKWALFWLEFRPCFGGLTFKKKGPVSSGHIYIVCVYRQMLKYQTIKKHVGCEKEQLGISML